MRIEKRQPKNEVRIHLASGKIDEKDFTFSLLGDGSGILVEFTDVCYFVSTEELIKEILVECGKI